MKKILKTVIFLAIIILTYANFLSAQSEKEVSLEGKVIEINEAGNFVIVNIGEDDGVMPRMLFTVYRGDEKICEIQIAKIRRKVSAADIRGVSGAQKIMVGDLITGKWVSKEEVKATEPEATKSQTPVKEKKIKTLPPKKTQPSSTPKKFAFLRKFPLTARTGEPVFIEVNASKDIVFFVLNQVLREHGFIITGSRKKEGLLTAQKALRLPLSREILADFKGEIDHEVVYSIKVEEKENVCNFVIQVDGNYNKNGEYRKLDVKTSSSLYNEAESVAQTVKSRAEVGREQLGK